MWVTNSSLFLMEIPEKNSATLYYFRLKETEKKLGKAESKRRIAEEKAGTLEKENKKLREKLEELEEENATLKNTKKKYASMIFKAKTKKSAGEKRGQKKGHKGVSRKKPPEEEISEEVDVTMEVCPCCNEIFTGCKRRYERVIEDIVIQPQVKVTKYIIHQYECKNCGNKVSGKSKEIIGSSPFGRKTFATVLFYRYRMKSPLEKIKEALEEIHGLRVSISGIQGLLFQSSVQFGDKYEELKEHIQRGRFANADETSWRVNGENWWTWIWRNDEITLFTTENTRGKGIPQKMLKLFKGLLGRDGLDSYNSVDTEQQICWVHLLRRAHDYCNRENATAEMALLKDTLKKLYHRMTKWHEKKHTKKERLKYHNRMKKVFINLWKKRKWNEKDSNSFIKEWIIQHKDRLVPFLKYEGSRPENNSAERDLRPIVIFRKITGGSKSERGIKATDINMSIIQTWVKQGYSLIQEMPVFGLSL